MSKSKQNNITASELARRWHVSRKTLYKWMRENPDFPKPDSNNRYPPIPCDKWRKAHPELGKPDPSLPSDKATQDARRIKAIADREEFKLAVLKKKYVLSEAVALFFFQLEQQTTNLLREKFENQLPADCFGRDLETIRSLNTAAIDLVCAQRQEVIRRIGELVKSKFPNES